MTFPAFSPQPDIEGAIGLLRTGDDQVRQFAAYLLGQTGDERTVEPLLDALNDPHPGVCGAAANALGKLGDLRAQPRLRALLDSDHPQVGVWAAYALTCLGDDQFHRIVTALTHPLVDVRRSGILALHQLGDPRAIPPLLTMRGDSARRFEADNTVGEAAEKALLSLGYSEN